MILKEEELCQDFFVFYHSYSYIAVCYEVTYSYAPTHTIHTQTYTHTHKKREWRERKSEELCYVVFRSRPVWRGASMAWPPILGLSLASWRRLLMASHVWCFFLSFFKSCTLVCMCAYLSLLHDPWKDLLLAEFSSMVLHSLLWSSCIFCPHRLDKTTTQHSVRWPSLLTRPSSLRWQKQKGKKEIGEVKEEEEIEEKEKEGK